MKSLKDFKNQETELSTIYGGHNEYPTRYELGEETGTDVIVDKNDDGIYNSGDVVWFYPNE